MIKVRRPKGSAPPGLAKSAARELRSNRKALKSKEKLAFNAYSSDAVKAALKNLFGRKCAFCESLLMGNQPGDIEHYRPKGKVVVVDPVTHVKTTVAGYYWLAAKWSNLLVACADCNRPRTQTDHDGDDRVIGKSSFFPVENESHRAGSPKGIGLEVPLLLNPCEDDPAEHLEFLQDGRVQAVKVAGTPSPKGVATIHYCGLARLELLQMRARHRRIVMAAIRHTVAALEAGHDPGADLDDLVAFMHPHEAYVALTRSLVKTHLSQYLNSLGLNQLI